ncbi:MAG: hypothetical protein LBR82_00460, partial [Desulfovibrio sp.]|nr:hypothetical protein [Desulfovibrio sp.]
SNPLPPTRYAEGSVGLPFPFMGNAFQKLLPVLEFLGLLTGQPTQQSQTNQRVRISSLQINSSDFPIPQ